MKLNKSLFILFFFFLSGHLFASTADTTLIADLNFDGREETVRLIHKPEYPEFRLIINNAAVSDTFIEGFSGRIELIDMDRNDNLREIVVHGLGSSDYEECFFYQFIGGIIVPCGYLPGNFGIKTNGDKILIENVWMGFWSAEFEYSFDTENKILKRIQKEFYRVDVEAEVTEPFNILKNRYDQAQVIEKLKKSIKITLVKADIAPVCRINEYGNMDEDNCDWYLIRTDYGTEGWCRLKDFRDNVDGLIWAG